MAKQCRFCLDDTETDLNPLIEPCICKGTVRYVHQRCLYHWAIRDPVQNGQRCSICLTPFNTPFVIKLEDIPRNTTPSLVLLNSPFLICSGIHCITMPLYNPHLIQAILQIAYIASFVHNYQVNNVKIYQRLLCNSYSPILFILYAVVCMQLNSTNTFIRYMYINLINGMMWRLHLHTLKIVNEVYEN